MNTPRPGDTYVLDSSTIRVTAVSGATVTWHREFVMPVGQFNTLAAESLRLGAKLTRGAEPPMEEFEV